MIFIISKQDFLFWVFMFHHSLVLFCGFNNFLSVYENLNYHFNNLISYVISVYSESISLFIMVHFSFAINFPEIFLLFFFCSFLLKNYRLGFFLI